MRESRFAWLAELALIAVGVFYGFLLGNDYQRNEARAYYKSVYELRVAADKTQCDLKGISNDLDLFNLSLENDLLRLQLADRELQCTLDGYELEEGTKDERNP